MIELINITKQFKENNIYTDFSYTFIEGNSYVITGKSGSGKSTLLNIISLLDTKYKGEVNYIDFPKSRKEIGYMFQSFGLVDDQSVLKNLKIIEKDKNKIIEALKLVSLEDKIDDKVFTLSGGEQQRIAFSKLILKDPRLIVCDEPTGNLDQENSDMLIDLLFSLKTEENIIICVTHDKNLLKKFDYVIEL